MGSGIGSRCTSQPPRTVRTGRSVVVHGRIGRGYPSHYAVYLSRDYEARTYRNDEACESPQISDRIRVLRRNAPPGRYAW